MDVEGLSRTHPATVAVRTLRAVWQLLLVLVGLFIFGVTGRGTLFAAGAGGVFLLFTGVSVGVSWLNWAFFRYGVVGDHLVITEGWLLRKNRSIPLARVQGVDLRADLFMRLLGLVDIVVQTAGGGENEPEAKIGAVPLALAERLRTQLLHGSAETAQAEASVAAVADGTTPATFPIGADPVGRMSDLRGAFGGAEHAAFSARFEYRVPLRRLVVAALTSQAVPVGMLATTAILAELYSQAAETADAAISRLAQLAVGALVAVGVAAFLIVAGVAVAVTVARDFGFVVRRVGERLETEAGLFERRMTGLSVRRIQAVRIERTALRRLFGFAAITVDTAGFGRGEEQKRTTASAIVPIARREEVDRLMHELLPEAERFPPDHGLGTRALRFFVALPATIAVLVGAAFVGAAALVVPVATAPVAVVATAVLVAVVAWRSALWRLTRFGTDERALGVVSGVLGQSRLRLGRNRIQSLAVRQNPFQRRAGLATVVALSVSGSAKSRTVVRHVGLHDAEQLIAWFEAR